MVIVFMPRCPDTIDVNYSYDESERINDALVVSSDPSDDIVRELYGMYENFNVTIARRIINAESELVDILGTCLYTNDGTPRIFDISTHFHFVLIFKDTINGGWYKGIVDPSVYSNGILVLQLYVQSVQ